MTPRTLFTWLARAEVVTWTLLLVGMVLKYGTRTTELGVSVFGMVHGVAFLGYLLAVVVVALDQRWSLRFTALAVAAGVPPYATVWCERFVERSGAVTDQWRLAPGGQLPRNSLERVLASGLARPVTASVLSVAGVAAVTAVLLLLGPPAPPGSAG
ncbi:MAG: DUF3817 domain-containing protein [Dermatophilaceae bacterium]